MGATESAAAGHGRRAAQAILDLLADQAVVIDSLTAAEYCRRPAGHPCTIGEQVRHCLDHLRAVVDGAMSGTIDYEARERGGVVETDPTAAKGALKRLSSRVAALRRADPDLPVRVVERVTPHDPAVEIGSTLGRELAFVASHTTHHNALIAVLARDLGRPAPERFGFAASTLAYLERTACAR